MAVINKKNVLNLGFAARRRWWDDIRNAPELTKVWSAKDLLGFIPGGQVVGGLVGTFLKFSVSNRGLVEFLIGDDPVTS